MGKLIGLDIKLGISQLSFPAHQGQTIWRPLDLLLKQLVERFILRIFRSRLIECY